MSSEHLYKVEFRYRRPDCCVLNRFYWVAKSATIVANSPTEATEKALVQYSKDGKIEITRVTELPNENHD